MALQGVNMSVVEESAGCTERGNLSVEVRDYNISCTNVSDLQRPAFRVKGKNDFFSSILYHDLPDVRR